MSIDWNLSIDIARTISLINYQHNAVSSLILEHSKIRRSISTIIDFLFWKFLGLKDLNVLEMMKRVFIKKKLIALMSNEIQYSVISWIFD